MSTDDTEKSTQSGSAVAGVMRHRGFAIRAFFGPSGAGAHVIATEGSPRQHTGEKPEPGAIVKYVFGEDSRSAAFQRACVTVEAIHHGSAYY